MHENLTTVSWWGLPVSRECSICNNSPSYTLTTTCTFQQSYCYKISLVPWLTDPLKRLAQTSTSTQLTSIVLQSIYPQLRPLEKVFLFCKKAGLLKQWNVSVQWFATGDTLHIIICGLLKNRSQITALGQGSANQQPWPNPASCLFL